ncbi:MAG: hypothetical protein CMP55_00605 [Flavobacteriales bacterium]|nr:hypothetical protein [Flavobacteriales bacterium]
MASISSDVISLYAIKPLWDLFGPTAFPCLAQAAPHFPMTIESVLHELLKKVSAAQLQIDDLLLQVKRSEKHKNEAREELEHSLLQLQHLQEDFERLHIVDQQRQDDFEELKEQVVAITAALEEERSANASALEEERSANASALARERKERTDALQRAMALEGELVGLKSDRRAQDKRISELQKSVDQLNHQLSGQEVELQKVMEELEHYFIKSHNQSIMLTDHIKCQERATSLLLMSLN